MRGEDRFNNIMSSWKSEELIFLGELLACEMLFGDPLRVCPAPTRPKEQL